MSAQFLHSKEGTETMATSRWRVWGMVVVMLGAVAVVTAVAWSAMGRWECRAIDCDWSDEATLYGWCVRGSSRPTRACWWT